jgi:membrane protein
MPLSSRWRRLVHFLQHGIWERPRHAPGAEISSVRRLLRIVVLAGRGFAADNLQLRASALTYYSLLSIVPIAALAFGIAKGFGLDDALEKALRERLLVQEQALEHVIEFAHTLLADTRGGLIAGAGVLLLVWAVIRLLNNIEKSFNAIWGVSSARSWVRKLTDYLAMVIIAPILLLVASSGTVFLGAHLADLFAGAGWVAQLGDLVQTALGLVPYAVIWLLLTLLYLTMPNTAVSWRAALAAGVVAGTLYQLTQIGYVHFQIGVVRNNAIYGGFAALPLLLIWLHISWLIVLLGAEIAFAVDNAGRYARERMAADASHHLRRLLAIRVAVLCAQRFRRQDRPPTASELADALDAPVRLVHQVLNTLTGAGLLAAVRSADDDESRAFVLARDPQTTRLKDVIDACDHEGDDRSAISAGALSPVDAHWAALDGLLAEAEANVDLAALADEIPATPATGATTS